MAILNLKLILKAVVKHYILKKIQMKLDVIYITIKKNFKCYDFTIYNIILLIYSNHGNIFVISITNIFYLFIYKK